MLVRTKRRNPNVRCLMLTVLWIRLDRSYKPWLIFQIREREREKNKNVSSTFHTMHKMNVPLSNFLKLALPTSKGVANFKDPYQFLDATQRRCEAMRCMDDRAVPLTSFWLEGEVVVNQYESKKSEMIVNSPPMAWKEFLMMFLKRFLSESVRDIRAYEFERLV